MFRRSKTVLIASAITLATASVLADPGNGNGRGQPKMFGKANPFTVDDVPPGRTRSRLESLPEPARRRAMEWLRRFDFPAKDVESMVIDDAGAVLYVDPVPPEPAADEEQATGADDPLPEAAASAAEDAFLLHSRPGAPNVLHLDFDGHTFSGTAWSSGTIHARPFDLDGSPASFDDAERSAIAEIWHRVAEDLAAFDIDVTTEEPASFGPYTGRVLITSKTNASGGAMPYGSAGGVAYVGVWGRSNYASYYSPALVYYDNLGKRTSYTAEVSAHEFGHNLGLSHDGTSSVTYYAGHGSGATSWAPIMGNSYYNNVTQWSEGEYAGANNTQDDLAIIASELFLIDDDHGDSLQDATPLVVDGSGQIFVSNRETDPHNIYAENKGIIETSGDQDVFTFSAAGPVDLSVTPAWDAFYRNSKRGANLDIQASLLNASGVTLATSDPTSETDANISASVPAGIYYLAVSGVGNGNYSDYASAGQYYISGTVPSGTPNEPPTANFGFGCADLSCSFTDSSTDSDGTIASWAWDFGDGASAAAQSPSHDFAVAGAYTVTLAVTDDGGETGTVSKNVTVTLADVVPPLVTAPADITTEATAVLTSVALGTATTDDGSPVTDDAPADGFPLGNTTVTWSATDAAGNTGTATQSVTLVDTTPPQLTPPADITILSGGDIGTATATDIFPVTITNDAPSTFPIGNTIVTWTATDTSGNTTTATQTVTVNNGTPPPPVNGIDFNDYPLSSFAYNQDRQGTTAIEDGGATLRLVGNTWKRIDFPYSVGPQTVIEFDFYSGIRGEIHGIGLEEDNSLTAGRIFELYGTQGWGIQDFHDYAGSGWTHYRIPVGQFYTGNMAYLVFAMDDDARAVAESRFRNLKVHEGSSSTQGPVVTAPADIATEATAVLTSVALGTATTDDGSPVTDDAPADGFPLGNTTVTWSATDAAGNTGTATQSVTLVDTTPPQLTPPADITILFGGDIGTATATDIFPVTITNDAPSTFPIGNTIVTWTATDTSGNTTTATQTVTVNNGTPPPVNGIDFNDYPLSSFAYNQDRQGTTAIEDGGATLRLVGNTWKRIDFPYSVGPQTVIEFDFYSGIRGEIHGIGLEEDNSLTAGRIFELYGTQGWGIQDFHDYAGSGWTHYRIPVGQFYTGNMAYLVFAMDHDSGAVGEGKFRNVTVYDE